MRNYFNDGTDDPPKLRVYLNLDNLADLPANSSWPGLHGIECMEKLAADGFEGVQITGEGPFEGSPLPHCGLGRINTPDEARSLAATHAERGDQCLTAHVGWGIEDDEEVLDLVDAVLDASSSYRIPIFIETHRATIAQDMWRTVQITENFPDVLFNGDFSHFYCGQEMVYGGLDRKLEFMAPIFDRVGFMHGRIASPGNMQMPVRSATARPPEDTGCQDYVGHFRAMWTLAMEGFLRNARKGDVLIFAPELLSGRYYYARLFPGTDGRFQEETDRYAEALIYKEIARECFREALKRVC